MSCTEDTQLTPGHLAMLTDCLVACMRGVSILPPPLLLLPPSLIVDTCRRLIACQVSDQHFTDRFAFACHVYTHVCVITAAAVAAAAAWSEQAIDIVGQVSDKLSTAGQLRLMQWVVSYQQTLRGLGVQEVSGCWPGGGGGSRCE